MRSRWARPLALLMETTGSLLAPMLMHMIFNAQSVVLMYVYGRFFPWLLEEQAQMTAGPEELIPTICVYLVLAVACTAVAGCVLVWLGRNEGRAKSICAGSGRRKREKREGGGSSVLL